jgi:prepilin-type N-terminal cleavage/methylation domain-containing protein
MWNCTSLQLFRRSVPRLADGDGFAASHPSPAAFTLVELLTVVAVIALMTSLVIPAMNAIRGGTDFASEVYNMAGMFDQARAYAMANSTFVLAGVTEVSGAQGTSASPQLPGTGRIAMAIIAAKNGTRPYQTLLPNSLGSWFTSSNYGTGSAFVPVTALMTFPNLHMVDLQPSVPATGPMARPPVLAYYDLSNASGASSTQFAWPLGAALGSFQYSFSKVVEYDPQGSARIISASNPTSYPDAIPLYIEIGIQPAHGTAVSSPVPGQTAGQIAAIQINGITGATHIYRP